MKGCSTAKAYIDIMCVFVFTIYSGVTHRLPNATVGQQKGDLGGQGFHMRAVSFCRGAAVPAAPSR